MNINLLKISFNLAGDNLYYIKLKSGERIAANTIESIEYKDSLIIIKQKDQQYYYIDSDDISYIVTKKSI